MAVPEMERLPDMDVAERADRWTEADKARFAPEIRRAAAEWKTRLPQLKDRITPERVLRLSRWAKPQMEAYRSVPSLERIEFRPVGTDAKRERWSWRARSTRCPRTARW